jgi:urea carboxylase
MARHGQITAGRAGLLMRPVTFSVREVAVLTHDNGDESATVRAERRAAFDGEPMRWSG